MKRYLFFITAIIASLGLHAQPDKSRYPDPEFGNEVCYLKKDSVNSLVRLEKNNSKMETKMKMAGFGGAESGYVFDGDKSSVRFTEGKNLSFIFSKQTSSSASTAQRDSMMRANGADPSMIGMMDGDPSSTVTLYKTESGKGQRKIFLQKSPGAFGGKMHSSDKYTFSVRKIRDGYWELVVDKNLPKGEYAFTMTDMMSMSGMGDILIFAFAID